MRSSVLVSSYSISGQQASDPGRAVAGAGGDQLGRGLRGEAGVGHDAERDGTVLADGGRVDVDVHEARAVRELAVAGGPAVEREPEPHDQVGVQDQVGDRRRGEPAHDVQAPVVAGEQAARDGGGRHERAAHLGEALDLLARAARAPTRDDHRPLRLGQEAGELGEAVGGRRRGSRQGDRPRERGIDVDVLLLHVERHVEDDRRALDERQADRRHRVLDGGGRRADPRDRDAEGLERTGLVDPEV
jgi:hypothetical protein